MRKGNVELRTQVIDAIDMFVFTVVGFKLLRTDNLICKEKYFAPMK